MDTACGCHGYLKDGQSLSLLCKGEVDVRVVGQT